MFLVTLATMKRNVDKNGDIFLNGFYAIKDNSCLNHTNNIYLF